MTYKRTIYFEDVAPYGKPYYLLIGKKPIKDKLKDYVDNPALFKKDWEDFHQELTQLEKERDQAKKEVQKQKDDNQILVKFIQNDLGFNSFNDAKTFLQGEKLADVVGKLQTETKSSEKDKETLKKHNTKLKGNITTIQQFLTKWGVNNLIDLNRKLEAQEKILNDLDKEIEKRTEKLEKENEELQTILNIYQKSDALSFFEVSSQEVVKILKQHQQHLYYFFYSVSDKEKEINLSECPQIFDDSCLFFGTFDNNELKVNLNDNQFAVISVRSKNKPTDYIGLTKNKLFIGDKVRLFKNDEEYESEEEDSKSSASGSTSTPTKNKWWRKGGNK
ncbi:hypothetical protein [endosymbiont GvMRE of Glomus versiforme]|uniref:hypothetical protein n=1 Tax=endosymbiont GvMRE of Glomus versiforme TaxID=2039283 RepID=UPI000EE237E8|nr:hypothetical protein [endosymbiont GvMRE of Glomus versiforme]RHZ37624.1 hypothetical protein GvMRE_I1g33 [endosymbiont GvMRE of Glomus versiforme]